MVNDGSRKSEGPKSMKHRVVAMKKAYAGRFA